MTFMTRPRASIWFEFFGRKDGKIITLVNGHTRSSSDFRVLTRHAEQAGLGVLLLDNRASGKSSVEGPFTLLDMKDDILGIWNELGIEKSSVLGISMGGCIAQSIDILHPERIDRLVLVSTAPDQKWIRSTVG